MYLTYMRISTYASIITVVEYYGGGNWIVRTQGGDRYRMKSAHIQSAKKVEIEVA